MECVPDTWKTLGPVEASIFRERLCLLWVTNCRATSLNARQ